MVGSQVLTADAWDGILYNCMQISDGNIYAPMFFVVYYILGAHIALNLFIASVLECFEAEGQTPPVFLCPLCPCAPCVSRGTSLVACILLSLSHSSLVHSALTLCVIDEEEEDVEEEEEEEEEIEKEQVDEIDASDNQLGQQSDGIELETIREEEDNEIEQSSIELEEKQDYILSERTASSSDEQTAPRNELSLKEDSDVESDCREDPGPKEEGPEKGSFVLTEEDITNLESAFMLFDTDGRWGAHNNRVAGGGAHSNRVAVRRHRSIYSQIETK